MESYEYGHLTLGVGVGLEEGGAMKGSGAGYGFNDGDVKSGYSVHASCSDGFSSIDVGWDGVSPSAESGINVIPTEFGCNVMAEHTW
jgi:hypothetical protein